MDNLLSGFLGAVIALFIAALLTRLNSAFRINKIRKAVVIYYQNTGIIKLDVYIENIERCVKRIELFANGFFNNPEKYDYMPMLTSEIVKSYGHIDILRIAAHDSELYSRIVDTGYVIDFLKDHLPGKIMGDYLKAVTDHFQEEKIEKGEARIRHLKHCEYLNSVKESIISNLNGYSKTASDTKENMATVTDKLGGNSTLWVLRYFLKQ